MSLRIATYIVQNLLAARASRAARLLGEVPRDHRGSASSAGRCGGRVRRPAGALREVTDLVSQASNHTAVWRDRPVTAPASVRAGAALTCCPAAR